MPHDYSTLRAAYPTVIARMPDVFNAHQFILELARTNQQAYVEALYEYRTQNPFQTVHQRLATILNDFSDLVTRDGDDPNTQNIWTISNDCSRWRKRAAGPLLQEGYVGDIGQPTIGANPGLVTGQGPPPAGER